MRIGFAIPGDIATPTGGYAYDRHILDELRGAGHQVRHIVLPAAFPDPDEAAVVAAVAALATADVDVLLVDGLAFGALPAERLAAVARPIVALVHHPLALETGLAAEAAARHARVERAALGVARGIVVTSPPTADILVADYGVVPAAITVAVPGLDPAWHQSRSPVAPPLVVGVGSIIARKGHDVLVAALREIADLDWQAVIVGAATWDPALATRLRAAAEPLGPRVAFPGALPEDDIRRLYRRASVFALATRYEGFGMVFLEAMGSGLPIVATGGGAVPSVVPPEAGRLVPVDDAPALGRALRDVLTDEALAGRLSDGARRTAARAASWSDSAGLVAQRLANAAGAT